MLIPKATPKEHEKAVEISHSPFTIKLNKIQPIKKQTKYFRNIKNSLNIIFPPLIYR